MMGEDRLALRKRHVHGRGRAPDLDRDRHRHRPGGGIARQRDGDRQPSLVAAPFEHGGVHPHRDVGRGRRLEGDELETHRLRQSGERVADATPRGRVDRPVVRPLIRADPDLGRAGAARAEVVVGRLEKARHVGRGRARTGRRQALERPGVRHLHRTAVRIDEQERARRAERHERLGHLASSGRELRVGRDPIPLGHARRAVEDHDGRVGAPARRQREPAARQRPPHREDDRGDRQHPQRHHEPMAQPRVASRKRAGGQEKPHRRPGHRLEASLVDEVDDDRQAHQRQRDEHPRLKKRHRNPRAAARPTRKRASTCSTGSLVSTRW